MATAGLGRPADIGRDLERGGARVSSGLADAQGSREDVLGCTHCLHAVQVLDHDHDPSRFASTCKPDSVWKPSRSGRAGRSRSSPPRPSRRTWRPRAGSSTRSRPGSTISTRVELSIMTRLPAGCARGAARMNGRRPTSDRRLVRTGGTALGSAARRHPRGRPGAAGNVVAAILGRIDLLAGQPGLGRAGRVPGTRELVVPGTPYLIPYRVRNDRLEIIANFHGRQRWPEKL